MNGCKVSFASQEKENLKTIERCESNWNEKIVDTIFHKRISKCGKEWKPESIFNITGNVVGHNKSTASKSCDEVRVEADFIEIFWSPK